MFYGTGGPPGIGAAQTAQAYPPILDTDRGADWIDGGRFLDQASYDWSNPTSPTLVKPGTILGKITSSGKYAPTVLGVVTVNLATNGTSLTVSAAQAAGIASRVGSSGTNALTIVGPPTAGGAVAQQTITHSAINVSTGVITITATGVAYALGSLILPADGSQAPLGLLGGGEYGTAVADQFGARRDAQLPRLLVAGQIKSANVPGLLSGDASSIAWLKAQLNGGGRRFIWQDEY